ncbi:GNAT family N-acetyltransferase [Phenylobacterium immobile]|uniref:GNAT family N-acetyltransferase n=1 Tax=Phenylobacterium immobile TaxID=21 RepID=UPI000B82E022|nr:GNAT family N-acetyltransferase [Phenylobacterium immobile]
MRDADLAGVVRVAAASFPDHFESLACFAERLALSPDLCFALELEGAVEGYLIAYPWQLGQIPPLNSLLGGLPADRENVYLHDLALAPAARGGGHTRTVVEALARAAHSLGAATLSLVSVNDSQAFWRGMGFRVEQSDALAVKLASYGPDARYMVRPL